jgi:hypothetical protein
MTTKPRTYGLNSRQFYEAVSPPTDPHMWAGGLPREPRLRDFEVIVERSTERSDPCA